MSEEMTTREFIEAVQREYPTLGWQHVVGMSIVSYRGVGEEEGLPERVPLKPEDLKSEQFQRVGASCDLFACTAAEEMYRAGFLDSADPIELHAETKQAQLAAGNRLIDARLRVLKWYREYFLRSVEHFYWGKDPKEHGRVIQAVLVKLAQAGTFRLDELARDALEAEQHAHPGLDDVSQNDPAQVRQAFQDGLASLIAHLLEGRKLSLYLKEGRYRIGWRQMRDKLASDSEKRQLAEKGEAATVSRDALEDSDTPDPDSEDPQEIAVRVEILRIIREQREGLPPAYVAAWEYLLPLEEEAGREQLAERYGVTVEQIRSAELRIKPQVEALLKRLRA